jgi:hypothetical protein
MKLFIWIFYIKHKMVKKRLHEKRAIIMHQPNIILFGVLFLLILARKEVWPSAEDQLCLFHVMQQLHKCLPKVAAHAEAVKEIQDDVRLLARACSIEEFFIGCRTLCQHWEAKWQETERIWTGLEGFINSCIGRETYNQWYYLHVIVVLLHDWSYLQVLQKRARKRDDEHRDQLRNRGTELAAEGSLHSKGAARFLQAPPSTDADRGRLE